jgi:hypothetical protein
LASRARGVFNGMNAPGIGAVQMTSGRVACGAGLVQLPVPRQPLGMFKAVPHAFVLY